MSCGFACMGLLVLACAAALAYFSWRVGVLNPAWPAFALFVYAAELLGFARFVMFAFAVRRIAPRVTAPPPLPAATVDVFIPTFDEPLAILRRTATAAVAMHTPHVTWLLDDGARPAVRALAEELGCRYLARSERTDAKAGNLNGGLAHADGAFVAVLDADHVADPRFLASTLGYFRDERVAFVQTPHAFLNRDSFLHLRRGRTGHNGSLFHGLVQASRGADRAVIFAGSAAVLRRGALDAIGGFATGTLSEDVHTSLRLHAAGWDSVFHPEPLAAAMAPLDGPAFAAQAHRWANGSVQILLREYPLLRRTLTPAQRATYVTHLASNLEGWRHLVIYALPIVMLTTGILPIAAGAATFLAFFVPYWLTMLLAYTALAGAHAPPYQSAVYNLMRVPASLGAVLGGARNTRFRVTPKARSLDARAAMLAPLVLLGCSLGAIAYALARAAAGRSPFSAPVLALLVAWAGVHVATAVGALALARRCARERRAESRLDCSFSAVLTRSGSSETTSVEIAEATGDGITLRTGTLTPGDYAGEVHAGGDRLAFDLSLRARPGSPGGGAVRWTDAATRARFEVALHTAKLVALRRPQPAITIPAAPRGEVLRSEA